MRTDPVTDNAHKGNKKGKAAYITIREREEIPLLLPCLLCWSLSLFSFLFLLDHLVLIFIRNCLHGVVYWIRTPYWLINTRYLSTCLRNLLPAYPFKIKHQFFFLSFLNKLIYHLRRGASSFVFQKK
jgi:hypothetical protein